jgi:hypothetical protein
LYRVSRSISAATRERITTGRINAIKAELKPADHLGARLYEAAKHQGVAVGAGTLTGGVTGHFFGPMVGTAVGAAVTSALAKGAKSEAIKAVDKLLVSPEFVDLARKTAYGVHPGQQDAIRRFVQSPGWRRFAHVMKMPGNATAAQQWVTRALQTERMHEQSD